MYKSFKARGEIQPFDLLFHRVEVLDAAGKIAEEERDVEQLVEISNHIAQASDEFIQVYLMLTEDNEEGDCCGGAEESKSSPVGFRHPSDED